MKLLFAKREMTDYFKKGVMILLFKKGAGRHYLGNWWPTTLLNTDYKVFVKIVANRMREVIANVIQED